MKTKVVSVMTMVLLFIALFTVPAYADDDEYTSGNYQYTLLEDGTVEITKYTGTKSTLTLPSEIDGKTVTSLGEEIFRGNSNVKKVIVPDTVLSIDSTFYMSEVRNITLGSGVKSIDEHAFYCAWDLLNITVSDKNQHFTSVNGILYNKAKTRLICVPAGKELNTLKIPEGVKVLGTLSIRDVKVTKLVIPSTVTKIESYAITTVGAKSLTIPGSVKTLEQDAIYHCQGLKTLVFQKGNLKSILDRAISSCTELERVEIPSNVTIIGRFSDCEAIKEFVVDKNNKNYASDEGSLYNKNKTKLYVYAPGITTKYYTIPDTVTTIEANAFNHADSLQTIYMHKNVKKIGAHAFAYSGLTKIYYEGTKNQYQKIERDTMWDSMVTYNYHIYRPAKNLKATQTADSVTLTWDSVKNETGYRVYRKTSDGWNKIADTTGTKYTVTGLKTGTKYTFAVKSYAKKNGKTIWAPYNTPVSTATRPSPIKKLEVSRNVTTATLTWNKVPGATGYRVYRYNPTTESWTTVVSKTTETKAKIQNLKGATQYTFSVRPFIATDSGNVWANTRTKIQFVTKPAKVTFSKLTAGTNQATLNWQTVPNATGYEIRYSTNSSFENASKQSVTKQATSKITIKKLTKGKTYYFKIRAYKTVDGTKTYGAYSTVKSVKIK